MNQVALMVESILVPTVYAFWKTFAVIISTTVVTTVMNLMVASATLPMSLNVLLVGASMIPGYVMAKKIVLMAAMKKKVPVSTQLGKKPQVILLKLFFFVYFMLLLKHCLEY